MNRQEMQIVRYKGIAGTFRSPKCISGVGIKYTCTSCHGEITFKSSQLRYAHNVGKKLECPDCSESHKGFITVEKTESYRLLECCACGNKYHRENDTKYFTCYCSLEKKKTEMSLYERLVELIGNGDTLSREELLPGSTHKVDIKLKFHRDEGDIVLYIEVDGGSHNSKTQKIEDRAQEELFEDVREENWHILRVQNETVEKASSLKKLMVFLDHLKSYNLGDKAVYHYKE